jgi:tetratricopeptide (TPR) repeat protein
MEHCRHGGPANSELESEGLKSASQLGAWPAPMDRLDGCSTLQEIQGALTQTVKCITQYIIFSLARTDPGSVRYFGALAVDAWINNIDQRLVQMFLLRALVMDHLQREGPAHVILQLELCDSVSSARRGGPSLLKQVKDILQREDTKTYLEYCTRGACRCIALAESLSEEKESRLHPNDDSAKARKRQREIEKLPPILKPASKFRSIKKKAATHLQAGRLEESTKLYKRALKILEDAIEPLQRNGAKSKWIQKLREETGRIESNLFLIFLRRKHPEEARLHADKSVSHSPAWSKPHSRRAVALYNLNLFEEAEAAIFRAIERCETEISQGASTTKILREYQDIQTRVEINLTTAQQENGSPPRGQLLKLQCSESDRVGSLTCLVDV